MNKQAINPNNLTVVQVVQNETADLSDFTSQVVMTSIYNGDDILCLSECLVPLDLKDYDFVWIEPMAVEAMWLDNEFLIDRPKPHQPFKSSRLVKVLDWVFSNWRVMLLIPVGLFAWWFVNEFGVKGAIINIIGWTAIWYAYTRIRLRMKS